MVAQGDDLVLNVTKGLQVFQELADGTIGAPLADTSNERGDSLHALTSRTLSACLTAWVRRAVKCRLHALDGHPL
jgi:hypothetical protein